MAFDLAAEMAKIRKQLDETRELIRQNAEVLRNRGDFGPRCQLLAARVEALAMQLPPPKPTPPVTEWPITVEEVELRQAGWLQRKFPGFTSKIKPDANGMIPVKVKRRFKVDLPDPRYPGSPGVTEKVKVEVKNYRKVEDEEEGTFAYEIYPEEETVEIKMPAIPPDEPPTEIQAAYIARRDELEREVRDLYTFIAEITRQVNASLAASLTLERNVEALVKRIDNLPFPVDAAAEMQRIRDRFDQIQQNLPDLTGELNDARDRLRALQEQARQICKELNP